jgi:nucleoside phosphorylase
MQWAVTDEAPTEEIGTMAAAPRVFLSYSHDSDEHADRVLALANALCDGGIDVILDRYVHPAPAEGWPRWMERNLDGAQFVLMVCTETYHRRAMGLEEAGKGLGVDWEGNLINNLIYHRINGDKPSGSRFIPLLLPGSKPDHIPIPVRGHTHYQIAAFDFTDPGFEALYRHLTDQPATPRPDLGPIQNLVPKPRPQAVPGPLPPSGGPTTNIGGRIVGSTVGAGNTMNVRDINASLSQGTVSQEEALPPTVGIITALSHESAAVRAVLGDPPRIDVPGSGAGRIYWVAKVPSPRGDVHRIVVAQAGTGTNVAAVRASLLLTHFPTVRSIIMCGIAGGIPKPAKPDDHVRLGDVVVSDIKGVVQYDLVKRTVGRKKTEIIEEIRAAPHRPSAELAEAVQALAADEHFGQRPWEHWLIEGLDRMHWSRPDATTDVLAGAAGPVDHPPDPKRHEGVPRVFLGPIASANTLLKDPIKRDALGNRFGAKAVEMEGSGVTDATWTHGIGYLVVRGICDYCDANKNDTWQNYAAMAAAAYVRALLEAMPGLGYGRLVQAADLEVVRLLGEGGTDAHLVEAEPEPKPVSAVGPATTPGAPAPAPVTPLVESSTPQHQSSITPPRIVPHKLFISYAHNDPDQLLAGALRDGLRRAGCEVFTDEIELEVDVSERIAASGYFILLLSARSVHSEMVREEVRLAHARRKAEGIPRLLPVRVAYTGPLGYVLGAWVNPDQWIAWQTPGDTERVLRQILDVVAGLAEAPLPGAAAPAGPAPSDEFRRPEPMADLSGLVAPGGAIRPDDPFYIERTSDYEIRAVAHRLEETVVIKAPRQLGKSTLLKRYLAECCHAGKKTALIDLSLFADQDLADYPRFLTSLAGELLDQFGLDGLPTIAGQPDMTRFVRNTLLRAVPDNLIIAIDEADRVLGQPYQAGFFSMLRYWHERRTDSDQPEWGRLELALVISTEPYLLIDDAHCSPFNVRAPIVLEPFNADECRELNRRYGRVLSDDQAERLRRELLNGHPFLTRLAYYRLTCPGAPDFDTLLRDAARPDGPFGDHLRALLAKLRRHARQDLLAALRQVIRHGTASNDDVLDRLQAAGLVRREEDKVAVGNGLYARFFKDLT